MGGLLCVPIQRYESTSTGWLTLGYAWAPEGGLKLTEICKDGCGKYYVGLENTDNFSEKFSCEVVGYSSTTKTEAYTVPVYQGCATIPGRDALMAYEANGCNEWCDRYSIADIYYCGYDYPSGCKGPLVYLMDVDYAPSVCANLNGDLNPIYYLGFAGTLSVTSVYYVYGALLLLLVIANILTMIKVCKRSKNSKNVDTIEVLEEIEAEQKGLIHNIASSDDNML
eukprot:441177_1